MKELALVKPQCIVEKNEVKKAKFPVFDVHTHMGKLLLGDTYENLYDTKEHLDQLKEYGVFGIVNHILLD